MNKPVNTGEKPEAESGVDKAVGTDQKTRVDGDRNANEEAMRGTGGDADTLEESAGSTGYTESIPGNRSRSPNAKDIPEPTETDPENPLA